MEMFDRKFIIDSNGFQISFRNVLTRAISPNDKLRIASLLFGVPINSYVFLLDNT